jgi:hypothetical protein
MAGDGTENWRLILEAARALWGRYAVSPGIWVTGRACTDAGARAGLCPGGTEITAVPPADGAGVRPW